MEDIGGACEEEREGGKVVLGREERVTVPVMVVISSYFSMRLSQRGYPIMCVSLAFVFGDVSKGHWLRRIIEDRDPCVFQLGSLINLN